MLPFFLQVFSVLQTVLSAGNSDLLTADQRHLVTCVKTVLTQHFISGESLLVSFPNNRYKFTSSNTDHFKFMEIMLQSINEANLWPVELYRLPTQTNVTSLHQRRNFAYIIFTWPEDAGSNVTFDLILQLESVTAMGLLKDDGHVFIVVTDYVYLPGETTLSIVENLWNKFNIFDVLVLVPVSNSKGNHRHSITRFNFYTWFPFHSSGRREILIDECILDTNKKWYIHKNLFPLKIPAKFQNYNKVTVFTSELAPAILLINNYTEGNKTVLEFNGPEIDLLNSVLETLNLSFSYSNLRRDNTTDFLKLMTKLVHRKLDVMIGGLPLQEILASYGDPSFPYYFTGFKWYVPCPKPICRIEKISKILSPSAWLSFVTSFVTVSVLMWGYASFFKESESRSYQTLPNCLYNVWAIAFGVSVYRKPITYELKSVFLLWVCYCYVMGTLYQMFFTSFLVNPGFKKQIESYYELVMSDMEYGYGSGSENLLFENYFEFITPETLSRSVSCLDYKQCFLRLLNDSKFATLQTEFFGEYFKIVYLSRKQHLLCSINDYFRMLYIVMYFPRGSHILTPINRVTNYATESGLIGKWTSNMQEIWKIRSGFNLNNDILNGEKYDTDYFVFTLSHLQVAFILLAVGLFVSFTVFFVEMMCYKQEYRRYVTLRYNSNFKHGVRLIKNVHKIHTNTSD
ncbi:hypothetical protein Cfor_10594 [Coptotermes formosanus]|uniref:Ionotropic glutamate receptor C-terminal domain-containing protein n=1 Tax=Coptotermes formosanus TaxID=36987 RepID=A0A6L2Q8F6_COPFO|nr:hypothetical protein Cfor_10594 [Coptotermes formosanus]